MKLEFMNNFTACFILETTISVIDMQLFYVCPSSSLIRAVNFAAVMNIDCSINFKPGII